MAQHVWFCVCAGSFGKVYKGKWRGADVAVKVSSRHPCCPWGTWTQLRCPLTREAHAEQPGTAGPAHWRQLCSCCSGCTLDDVMQGGVRWHNMQRIEALPLPAQNGVATVPVVCVVLQVVQHSQAAAATVANEIDLMMSFQHPHLVSAYHFVTWRRRKDRPQHHSGDQVWARSSFWSLACVMSLARRTYFGPSACRQARCAVCSRCPGTVVHWPAVHISTCHP